AVPVVSANLRAGRALAATGDEAATTARGVLETTDPQQLDIKRGRVPVEQVEAVTPALDRSARLLGRSLNRLVGLRQPYLLPALRHQVEGARRTLQSTS